MTTQIPIPMALRQLIESNNQLLRQYQNELTTKVMTANEEMMRLLGLDPNEGWRLDLETFTYVKIEQIDDTSVR
jgi:hypothetical protein